MEKNHTVFYKIIFATILVLMLSITSLSVSAADDSDNYNCRMYGAISDNLPDGLIQKNLFNDQYSLRNMARLDSGDETNYNINGWGLATYNSFGSSSTIYRGETRAFNDALYTSTISNLNTNEPKILIGHVRHCSSGCCLPLETVENPHPFTRVKNGKTWTFVHNGDVNKATMRTLINTANTTYLASNAPFGSGVPECTTNNSADDAKVVDSELYFLYVMEIIESNGWNTVNGITAALKNMNAAGLGSSNLNFLMSDGETLYGFARGKSLNYKYDSVTGTSAVASQVPNSTETNWTPMSAWQLAILKPNQMPIVINDVRAYSPPSQTAPAISNPGPVNTAVDVALNPTLQADINDAQNESVDWTVQLWNGASWQTLSSGTEADGAIRVNVPTTTITNYNTTYNWKVTARDPLGSGNTTEATYTFTTKKANYAPTITNFVPADGQSGVKLNSTLTAYVEDKDDNLMNISFSINDGTGWKSIINYTNRATGNYNASGKGYITKQITKYQWRVRAVDTTGLVTEQTFNFTSEGTLALKWTTAITNNDTQIMPLMGDVDGDGTQEIIFSAKGNIYSLNGKTGAVEWSATGSADSAVELADLNNDGTPEILFGMNGPRVRALNGDGSVRWTSAELNGEGQPMFPIVAADIDGDGYPTIYFVSEDTTPEKYSGNMTDYTGAVSMLDHNGNVLRSSWLYHPCWGGPSIGDANFDGQFELYVGDRRDGYTTGIHSQGIQSFDAETLTPLWSRPDIHHSSPMPILADVNKDGTLDVVAEKIVGVGPMVLNALTGTTMADYSNKGLPTHGTGTVYDIDHDGNLEIIMATGYPDSNSTPMDFAVFDLVSGVTEFRPTFSYHTTWPPKVGDVLGDSNMEIIATMGNQGFKTATYPILIYDQNFDLVANISVSNSGQLMPARVYDTDSDGYNELVVASMSGKIFVYDTPAPTPNPAPRTWVQMYSEYRLGAAEYVAPPGPQAPVIKDQLPVNGSENLPLGPMLSILTYDFQKDPINVKFEVNDGNGWQTVKNYTGVGRGTYTADTTGFVTEASTTYQWRATTDDGKGHSNVKTFSFETVAASSWKMPGWNYRKQIVIDHTKVSGDLTNFPVLIDLTDANVGLHAQADGDDLLFTSEDGQTKLNHEIESYGSSNGHLITWVNVPSLSSVQDTILYLYYGNPAVENQQNPEAVWDSNYLAVQHLKETSGTVYDSTARNNDGSPLNGVVQNVTGKIDGADQFDGVNDMTQLPQVFTNQTQFTIEGWMNPANKQGYAISQRDSASHGPFIQYYPTDGSFQLYLNNKYVAKTSTANAWHYVVGTFDGSNATLYVDAGTPTTATGATISWPVLPMLLGDRSTGGRAFQGLLDEIRFSDIARSESYVKTSFNNHNNPGAFMIVGSEEMASSKPVVSNVLPENEAQEVPLNVSSLQFDLSDNGGDMMNYTVITSPNIGSHSGLNVASGTFMVPVSGLQYETVYTWTVNVTDGKDRVFKTYTFTTVDEGSLIKDSAFDTSTDSADLRTNVATQDWYESRAQNPSLLTLDTNNVSGNSGKKARLSGGTNASIDNAYLSQEFKEAQTGNFSVSWDIFIESIVNAAPYRAGMSLIGDDTFTGNGPNADNSERFVYMGFSSYNKAAGKMDLVARDRDDGFNAGQMTVIATDLDMGVWHNIRVDLNLGSDTYDVYVDGVKKATVTSRNVKTSVTHISFAQWNDGAGTFYVDNVHSPAAPFVECTENSQCSDNVFCNGEEQCIANSCVAGTAPVVDDGLFCTADSCDEVNDTVLHLPVSVDDNVSCTVDSCDDAADMLVHAPNNAVCDNSLACDGIETCDLVQGCKAGTAVDCTANNLLGIATCNNNPDNIPVTFDSRSAFTSVCGEPSGTCSIGDPGVTSTCDFTQCGAQCDSNHTCAPTDCDYKDGCVGKDYYDYSDAANSCGTDCACSNNTCAAPLILYNDSRCGECLTDSDCDILDQDYCDGNTAKHNEGKCNLAHVCETNTSTLQICDDGAYCNGQETCNLGTCQPASAVDCSVYNLPAISTCVNDPDNNSFTFDSASGFTSSCNEAADACTSGAYAFTHVCNKASCGAECEANADCAATDCDYKDGCDGTSYNDYSDVANSCTAGCSCTANVCGAAAVLPNDSRCKTALINDSAFDGSTNASIRTNDAGQDWYESRGAFTGGNSLLLTMDMSNVSGNTGNKAKLTGSTLSTGNAYMSQELNPAQTGVFSVEWDVNVDEILAASPYRGGWMFIGDDADATKGPNSITGDRFVFMNFYRNGGGSTGTMDLQARNRAGTYVTLKSGLNLDQWYKIRVLVNTTGGSYDVYVDNVYVASVTSATAKTSLPFISFATWNDGAGTFYVDNVQEYLPLTCIDIDGDGYGANCALGADCDDTNNAIHPGAADALCDNVDNDCDLSIDENYVINATSCGIGACAAAGQLTCSAGVESDSCTAGTPAADDANCNNVDDDCSGTADEDYTLIPTTCGFGVCERAGQKTCIAGVESDSCAAGSPTGLDDNCNNVDENCDGTPDNAYVSAPTSCGTGVCTATGQKTCAAGVESDSCIAGAPTGADADCNAKDDDCDGIADNHYVITPTSCGTGECHAMGTKSCIFGVETDSCTPLPSNPESCDGKDNDCDGSTDEDGNALCDDTFFCNGQETCAGTCQPGTAPVVDDGVGCTADSCDEDTDSILHSVNDAVCQDGAFCNGAEVCDALLDCRPGTAKDCSANNVVEIATCDNSPDDNTLTWDYLPGYTSLCLEATDECSSYSISMTHECDISCGAECDIDNSCADTDCDFRDGCVGLDYYNYSDVSNTCEDDCGCTANACGAPAVSYNDARCGECLVDTDCSAMNSECAVGKCGVDHMCYQDFMSNTIQCRAPANVCDSAEYCTGTTASCPTDAFAPATTICRVDAGLCDIAETCTGTSAACPTDAIQPITHICRSSTGPCDVSENCNGISAACPADSFAPSTIICKAAAGVCDMAERCTGSSATCPADSFAPATTVCKAAVGVCDIAELCTGSTASCPTDAFAPITTICRPMTGDCDIAENCDGSSAMCPMDAIAPATTVCRAAASTCDAQETCSGISVVCPADGYMPPGTVCNDVYCSSDVSYLADTCDGNGACVDSGSEVCAPYTCDSGSGLCNAMPCDDNSDCQSGSACSESGNCLSDTDGDDVADVDDNCVDDSNPLQEDCNDNGLGDACDSILCECTSGETKACGSSTGECEQGTQTCQPDGTWGTECVGEIGPTTETCDFKDNDCDGEEDEGGVCSTDCEGADLNSDGKVDIQDLVIITSNIDRTDCSISNSYCEYADINKDGIVNGADLNILTANFGETGCTTDCGGADLNSDGSVNASDLGIINTNFGRTDCAIANSFCDKADINLNGAVNGDDLKLFTPYFGKTNCAAAPVCVPSAEICDGLDNDCDLLIDEGNVCVPISETSCSDGIDNDLDNMTDCLDPDCVSDPVCIPAQEILVINEIDYDQPSMDTAEFIEIKNIGVGTVNLDNYELRLINGNVIPPASYSVIDLPNVNLDSGDYYVICSNSANVLNCDLDVTPETDLIQNGAPGSNPGFPDAIALYDGSGVIRDAVSYEGNVPGYTEGTGVLPVDDAVMALQGLSRNPDGQDTNNNAADFILSCSTPGMPNVNYPDCANPPITTETICDDGIDEDGDFTTDCDDTDCALDPYCDTDGCGDAVCGFYESCSTCPADCGICQTCGNSVVEGTETCDDANTNPGDGCSATCSVEYGFNCGGSPSVCTTICGDGRIAGLEACDDENTNNHDGCSWICSEEAGWTCTGEPSVCTEDCVAETEICDGKDNDCDGITDEDIASTPTTCGIGACAATGAIQCIAGEMKDSCAAGTPGFEICDGVNDENCDGIVDEGCECTNGANRPCGSSVGTCVAGTQSCVAGSWSAECVGEVTPQNETCDNADNDCDGATDEDIASTPTTCGLGACVATGELQCVAGGMVDSCTAGTPGHDSTCNGIDDDCNGKIDDGGSLSVANCGCYWIDPSNVAAQKLVPETCNTKDDNCNEQVDDNLGTIPSDNIQGACSNNFKECRANPEKPWQNIWIDSLLNYVPTSDDANCNGIDEDCSGAVDEDYFPASTSCGLGVCAATGMKSCVVGVETDSCTPGTPTGLDDNCNGIDENCDGTPDNAYISTSTSCGTGVCARTGSTSCLSGVESDSCTAGTATGLDNDCNLVDEDCDGSFDEHYSAPITNCGVGACVRSGLLICSSGATHDDCSPGTPGTEICGNSIDENCDGTDDVCPLGGIDEDFEGSFPATGWVLRTATGPSWQQIASLGYNASHGAAISPFLSGGDAFLVAPAVQITDGMKLKFLARYSDDGGLSYLFVRASNKTNSLADVQNAVPLSSLSTGSSLFTVWTEYSYDLSSLAGQTVYLAFEHYNFNGDRLFIDEVSVKVPVCIDADVDGYGAAGSDSDGCAHSGIDCDDSNAGINPGAEEACDGVDNDCDVATTDGAQEAWYGASCDGLDSDLCKEGTYSCSAGTQQCLDVSSDDVEICDGLDNDCDLSTDEGLGSPLAPLQNGVCSGSVMICYGMSGWVASYPSTYELTEVTCDTLDNDCDESIDEGDVCPPTVSISSAFDSGSIGAYTIVGNQVDLIANTETMSTGEVYTYWLNFKIAGVQGKDMTFNINNADLITFLSETGKNDAHLVYSCDGATWNRITTHSYASPTFTFTKNFECDEPQIAMFFPFSYTEMQNYLDSIDENQYVQRSSLGLSQEGRNLDLVVITNKSVPLANKKIIYIMGRIHSAETINSFMIEGMIDFLLSDNVNASRMRNDFAWYIVPMVNPDGVFDGTSRMTPAGRNPNRDWANTNTAEINLLRDNINSLDAAEGIDMFIDWESQMNDNKWYNFVYSPTGNTFYSILSSWTDYDSQSASGASDCTSAECTVRGYVMTNILFNPTFVFEATPHLTTWTLASMKQQGVNFAYAVNQYFPPSWTCNGIDKSSASVCSGQGTCVAQDSCSCTGGYTGTNCEVAPPAPTQILAENDFETIADSAALRTNSAGQDWYESRGSFSGGNSSLLTLDTNNIGGNTGNKAALKNFGIINNTYLTQDFAAQTGNFNLSFDIYIDSIQDNANYDRVAHIYVGNDLNPTATCPTGTSNERFVYLVFYDGTPGTNGTDLILKAKTAVGAASSTTSSWTTVTSSLSYDTWYNVKIAVNFASNSYDVTINGIKTTVAKNPDFTSTSINYISFASDSSGRGDFYVDNVYSPALN